MPARYRGIYVPLVTPLNREQAVCEDSVARLLEHVGDSVDGLVPCLTTGEGWRLTAVQWRDMVRSCVRHAAGRVVVAGIVEATTAGAIEHAERAAELGCTAVIATKPFGSTVSQAQIRDHYAELAERSPVGVFAYNEAWLSGNTASPATLAALPALAGVKESTGDIGATAWMDAHPGEFPALFQGAEELLHLSTHFAGYMVAAANLYPELCRRLLAEPSPAGFRFFRARCHSSGLLGDSWIACIKSELHRRGILAAPGLATRAPGASDRGA